MKKYVCLDARLFSSTGIGTFLKGMLEEIQEQKPFHLYLLHLKKDLSALKKLIPMADFVEMKSQIYTMQEQFEFLWKVPRCDLFWVPHFNIPIGPVRAKKRLATIHDTYHLTYANNFTFKEKVYAQIMYRAAGFLSHKITTPSLFSKMEILKHRLANQNKIEIIPLGAKKCFGKKKPGDIRAKYNLPEKYLISVTNYKPHKNMARIIEAVSPILPLVVVGEKRPASGVISLGQVCDEDLAMLYENAEALIFASLYEGFGLPAIEAMASGCPVVVSNRASLREVCQGCAEYVDPISIESMRQGVLSVLNKPQKKKENIQKGYCIANARSFSDCAKEHLALIETMI